MSKLKINSEAAKSILTPNEALELLSIHLEKRKKRVHTMTSSTFALMGCDMDLSQIKAIFKKAEIDDISLSGPNMRGISHGVGVRYNNEWMFLETDKVKIDAIRNLRNLK